MIVFDHKLSKRINRSSGRSTNEWVLEVTPTKGTPWALATYPEQPTPAQVKHDLQIFRRSSEILNAAMHRVFHSFEILASTKDT